MGKYIYRFYFKFGKIKEEITARRVLSLILVISLVGQKVGWDDEVKAVPFYFVGWERENSGWMHG